MADLVASMKKAALEAVAAGKPVAVVFGVVANEKPLTVSVEQKMMLTEKQLLLSRGVTDYDVDVTMDWGTSSSMAGEAAHAHGISGRKRMRVHAGLKTGEKVLLLRMAGGQQYLILDRLGAG